MSLFPTITGAHWRESLARREPNTVSAQIALRRARLLFLGVIVSLSALRAAPADDRQAAQVFFRSIAAVEGVNDPARPGPNGELGIYRIRPATWRQHTRAPFSLCGTDRQLERAIAEKHRAWLVRSLIAAGEAPTPYRLALAWNAGLEGSRKANAAARDYARCVANLCSE